MENLFERDSQQYELPRSILFRMTVTSIHIQLPIVYSNWFWQKFTVHSRWERVISLDGLPYCRNANSIAKLPTRDH